MRRVNEVTGRPRTLRFKTGGVRCVIHRTEAAMELIGPLAPGDRITGLTGGQFSAIDAMEHMVNELGPADVRITAWATGIYDAQRVRSINADGRITTIRFIVDKAPFEKSPQYAGQLIEHIGVDNFRAAAIHSKVIVVSGERGNAVMRTSMGFNKNTRTEQFDIDVCDDVAGFYTEWFDALWEESGRRLDNRTLFAAVYDRFLSERSQSEAGRPPSSQPRPAAAPKERRRGAVRLEDITMSQDELLRLLGD